jgi:hypothetical protein
LKLHGKRRLFPEQNGRQLFGESQSEQRISDAGSALEKTRVRQAVGHSVEQLKPSAVLGPIHDPGRLIVGLLQQVRPV